MQDLLTLARLDESPDLEREPVDVVALLGDARAERSAQSPGREITLEGDGPLVVLGDGDRLRQVINNLIQNALVHTEDGVAIDLRATAEDGLRSSRCETTARDSRRTPPSSASSACGARRPAGVAVEPARASALRSSRRSWMRMAER